MDDERRRVAGNQLSRFIDVKEFIDFYGVTVALYYNTTMSYQRIQVQLEDDVEQLPAVDRSLQPIFVQAPNSLVNQWELLHQYNHDSWQNDVEAAFANAYSYHGGQPRSGNTRRYAALAIPVALIVMVVGWYQEYCHLSKLEHAKWASVLADPPSFCDGTRPVGLIDLLTHSVNRKHRDDCNAYYFAKQFGPPSPNIIDAASGLFSRLLVAPFAALVAVLTSVTWALQFFLVAGLVVLFLVVALNVAGRWRQAILPTLPWSGSPHATRRQQRKPW
jgi:hypothetical protein